MPTSSIDDLLAGVEQSAPTKKQVIEQDIEQDIDDNYDDEEHESSEDFAPDEDDEAEGDHIDESDTDSDSDEIPQDKKKEYDEYGNEKERMPKGLKDRLDRKERQHQQEVERRDNEIENLRAQLANRGASHEVQQAARDFEYDPDAKGDWQQQLASFVKQTVNSMTREQEESQVRAQESRAQQEFEGKFRSGMGKFHDFVDTIGGLGFQITNPMTLATRAMNDPAAFLYAAAKQNPKELERISKMKDPYAQMAEMGKLEERMRKNKTTTKAPRPLERTRENASIPAQKKSSEPTIEDLIAKSDTKRLGKLRSRQGGRR